MKKKHHINRRQFLGQASCASLGCATLLNSLVQLKTFNAAAASNSSVIDGTGYKAMVCILLAGGNDSYNMLMPTETSEYNIYAATRSNLAIPSGDILGLNGTNHGVHPSMSDVRDMYNNNELAFLSNVGTLVTPTTKSEVLAGTANIPLGLLSHADQIQQWQTSVPHERSAIGWGGKVADLMSSQNSNQNVSMNISLSGSNIFQSGNNTVEYAIDPYYGASGINGYDEPWLFSQMRTQAIDSMLNASYQDAFKQSYIDVIRVSRDAYNDFSTALANVPDLTTSFSNNYLSESMKMIAKVISARTDLSMTRQIFYVTYGGWDHHDEVLNNQTDMLGVLNDALFEFKEALNEINMFDCVTTFTISDFARTLTSNGNGTDHAWGGNVIAMGGAVNGGSIYGNYPLLDLNGSLEIGGGVLLPELSTDEYFAELAMWYGVSNGDLSTLFPNLNNFYSIGSGNPIGFLTI